MIVFLIGFMGSGKSSIGRMVAEKLSWSFLDTDTQLENKSGKSISEFFDQAGESAFRREEKLLLSAIIPAKENIIVATGGGMPCFSGNIELMNEHGITIYLKLPASLLAERLQSHENKRPLLTGKTNLNAYITEVLAEREFFYKKTNYTLDIQSADNEKQLAVKIEKLIKNHKNGK